MNPGFQKAKPNQSHFLLRLASKLHSKVVLREFVDLVTVFQPLIVDFDNIGDTVQKNQGPKI